MKTSTTIPSSTDFDVSVIIPSYKPGAYFEECLASVGDQSLDKEQFEIIIVLNGCGEPWLSETKALIEKYLPRHNVKFIHIEQSGVSNARNMGIDVAGGQYITFIDDDDYISPMFLEIMLETADPETVSVCDSHPFDDVTKEEVMPYRPHIAYQKLVGRSDITILHARAIFNGPWMKLLNRSFIQGFRFDTTLAVGEDSLFMFAISKNINAVRLADRRALYHRRCRCGSAYSMHRAKSYWLKNCLRLISKYSIFYLSAPFSYNFKLYIRCILGTLRGTWSQLVRGYKLK